MSKLPIPQHETELLLEFPHYWDSYETAIDKQISIIEEINQGNYIWLEQISMYYSNLSKLLFDKLYCADYHHIHKAVISGVQGTLNKDVINEFFRLNFSNEHFNYDDLLEKIRLDIVKAVKEYTFNLPFEELKNHAYTFLDPFFANQETRYWLKSHSCPENPNQINYNDNDFVTFRRAKQLEKIIAPTPDTSYYFKEGPCKERSYLHLLYAPNGQEFKTLYFINVTADEFFNKQLNI